MDESVILRLPLALLLYGGALFFCLFERVKKATQGRFFLLSTLLAVIATAYSLVMGAGLWESGAVMLIFLLLNMGVEE